MIRFTAYEKIPEQEINDLIESLEWEDILEMYTEEEYIYEGISATERMKRSNRMRARKTTISTARGLKLKRAASVEVLKRRAKVTARRILMKKYLKGRSKQQLSAAERSALETRISAALAAMKNYPERLLPKIRELEKKRLRTKSKHHAKSKKP